MADKEKKPAARPVPPGPAGLAGRSGSNPLGVKRPEIYHTKPRVNANALSVDGLRAGRHGESTQSGGHDKAEQPSGDGQQQGSGAPTISKTELIAQGKLLGVGETEIRDQIKAGAIKPVEQVGERMSFDKAEAETWLKGLAEGPAK